LFFDYNGNGVQDGEEPAVTGALVQLKDDAGTVIAETLTDSSGDYRFEDIKIGSPGMDYVYVHLGIDHLGDKEFRYMCRSPAEFRAVNEGYQVSLQKDTTMDIGLMEGFLTQPVSSKTHFNSSRLLYDWDPDPQRSLWWNGRTGNDTNNHGGHDYDMPDGERVLAAAPGEVAFAGEDTAGKGVQIGHYAASLGAVHHFYTDYWHLSESLVHVGDQVWRGQVIGKSGHTYNQHPHLHFGLYRDEFAEGFKILDPYSPVFELKPKNNGYWRLDAANPQGDHIWVPWTSKETNPNVLNYWTRKNSPQFPAASMQS